MRLVLIGPRGAGKSTLARRLAVSLGIACVSSDDEIARAAHCSIAEYVSVHGWPAFRELEARVLRQIVDAHARDLVLDAGGGVVVSEQNRVLLRDFDGVFYVYATVEVLAARISSDRDRPPLTDVLDPVEEVRRVLAEREPHYRSLASLAIDTGVVSCDDAVAMMTDWIQSNLETPS